MPNCDFYATGPDIDDILRFVFALEDVAVFESYSPYDKTLERFTNPANILERYPEIGKCKGNAPSVLLELCPISHIDDKHVIVIGKLDDLSIALGVE